MAPGESAENIAPSFPHFPALRPIGPYWPVVFVLFEPPELFELFELLGSEPWLVESEPEPVDVGGFVFPAPLPDALPVLFVPLPDAGGVPAAGGLTVIDGGWMTGVLAGSVLSMVVVREMTVGVWLLFALIDQ
jgi:hypothetical protein